MGVPPVRITVTAKEVGNEKHLEFVSSTEIAGDPLRTGRRCERIVVFKQFEATSQSHSVRGALFVYSVNALIAIGWGQR